MVLPKMNPRRVKITKVCIIFRFICLRKARWKIRAKKSAQDFHSAPIINIPVQGSLSVNQFWFHILALGKFPMTMQ